MLQSTSSKHSLIADQMMFETADYNTQPNFFDLYKGKNANQQQTPSIRSKTLNDKEKQETIGKKATLSNHFLFVSYAVVRYKAVNEPFTNELRRRRSAARCSAWGYRRLKAFLTTWAISVRRLFSIFGYI